MNETQRAAVAAIELQQKKLKEGSTAWCVGEQLKDICASEPENAALILKDLEIKEMSVVEAEKKIRAYADKNHGRERAFGVSPRIADGILREFYGLRAAHTGDGGPIPLRSISAPTGEGFGEIIDLADFL